MDDFVLNISDSSDENDTPERAGLTVTPEVKGTTSTGTMNSGNRKSPDPEEKSDAASDSNSKAIENNENDLNGTKKGRTKRGQRNRLFDENSKFLADFDPGKSQREKRKLERNVRAATKQIGLYNEHGVLRSNGVDLCDCLTRNCPGCHMPCRDCGGSKCGTVCRKHRKWMYERVEVDAKDVVKENPFKP
ncbi:ARL14 effector protein [Anopheles stephensi]|uniref:ARF7EP_C domain-containing protein n=1 Tax=Anopheles stephensi TaxID=30069 RepID=A0A182YJJ1_ANOST|nr:ARL14 effector protein [Anopheles stephensi]